MAACGSLDHIFEKPLSENPKFFDSLSPWKHIKSMDDSSSFTELFGELHFKDCNIIHHNNSTPSPSSPSSSSSSSSSTVDYLEKTNGSKTSYYQPTNEKKNYRHSDSFSSMNSESLSLCTEGLGFESFDDVDDLFKNDSCNNEWRNQERRTSYLTKRSAHHQNENCENIIKRSPSRTSSSGRGEFPPPISCIGRSGKPWVCLKSYREGGRFILKEIRIPTQELLHACRENGRLKLHFIQSDDEIIDEEDDNDEEEENQDILKNDSN